MSGVLVKWKWANPASEWLTAVNSTGSFSKARNGSDLSLEMLSKKSLGFTD